MIARLLRRAPRDDLTAVLRERDPRAIVLRSRATRRFRRGIRAFPHGRLPRRDAPFAISVTTEHGFAFHRDAEVPFLKLAWGEIGGLRLRSYGDYLVPDLVTADGGYVSHVLWIAVGSHALDVTLWGDEVDDSTTSELDDYGVKVVINRLERLKRSSSHPR